MFCPLCSSVLPVVQPFSYAATPSGYTLGETAPNSNEIYCPDEIKGQAICAFVSLEHGVEPTNALKEELKKWVAKEIGSLAKPDDIRFTDTLPKTRSGKIMRRLLRELASSGEVKGDTTTLEDFGVIAKLRSRTKSKFFLGLAPSRSKRFSPSATRQPGVVRAFAAGSFRPAPETCAGTDRRVCRRLRRPSLGKLGT